MESMNDPISVCRALDLIQKNRVNSPVVSVPLAEALGAILAVPVYAMTTRPPVAVSAMDGYAVRLGDVGLANRKLRIIGEAPAGMPFEQAVGRGEAVRIFTGAEVPDGSDHIVIQEDVVRTGLEIVCNKSYGKAEFIRAAGRDFHRGDLLMEPGVRIGPVEIATAAAANHADLTIVKRPRVAIIANGDELVPPGSSLKRGEIVSSNPAGLAALIREWGGEVNELGIATDSESSIINLIGAAADFDIILPVGGASVGDHDHMKRAFTRVGFENIFEKISIRPGKPTWMARRGNQLALGLPGNPASSIVCAHLFLRPLLSGRFALKTIIARLEGSLSANGARQTFLRGNAYVNDEGVLTVSAKHDQDSSLTRPFLGGNALIQRAAFAEPLVSNSKVSIILTNQF